MSILCKYLTLQNIQIQLFIVEHTLHKLNKYKSSTSFNKLKKFLRQKSFYASKGTQIVICRSIILTDNFEYTGWLIVDIIFSKLVAKNIMPLSNSVSLKKILSINYQDIYILG